MKPIRDLSDDELAQLVRRAIALPDAPDALVRAAIALMPDRPSPSLTDLARSAIGKIVATLTFDSWAQSPLALGVRGVRSSTRQLLFSAMERDIDLRVWPAGASFSVAGQVLGPDRGGSMALTGATSGETTSAYQCSAELDDLGEFRIDGVPAGRYALTLRVTGAEIELPPIDIGEG